jgi:hypothetical protein
MKYNLRKWTAINPPVKKNKIKFDIYWFVFIQIFLTLNLLVGIDRFLVDFN